MGNSKGQNLIEYILLVIAVILVCMYFFLNQTSGPMGSSINAGLYSMVNEINNIQGEIKF